MSIPSFLSGLAVGNRNVRVGAVLLTGKFSTPLEAGSHEREQTRVNYKAIANANANTKPNTSAKVRNGKSATFPCACVCISYVRVGTTQTDKMKTEILVHCFTVVVEDGKRSNPRASLTVLAFAFVCSHPTLPPSPPPHQKKKS